MDTASREVFPERSEPPERFALGSRAALLLDVDGTLLDIAPGPESVVVPEGLPDLLSRLCDRLGGALGGRTLPRLPALPRAEVG